MNNLEWYEILNGIKPPYHKTRFPYDDVTPNKVLFTGKQIMLTIKATPETEKFDRKRDQVKREKKLKLDLSSSDSDTELVSLKRKKKFRKKKVKHGGDDNNTDVVVESSLRAVVYIYG